MTRKSIEKQLDAIIDEVCKFHGYDPKPEAKGGEIEAANALVYSAIRTLRPHLLMQAGVPPAEEQAPEVTDEVGEQLDLSQAA